MAVDQIYSKTYYQQLELFLIDSKNDIGQLQLGLEQKNENIIDLRLSRKKLSHRLHSLKSMAPEILGEELLTELSQKELDLKELQLFDPHLISPEDKELNQIKSQLQNIQQWTLMLIDENLKKVKAEILQEEKKVNATKARTEPVLTENVKQKPVQEPQVDLQNLKEQLLEKELVLISNAKSYDERVYFLEISIMAESKLPDIRQDLFFTKLEEEYNLIRQWELEENRLVFFLTSMHTMEDINQELASDLIKIETIQDISSYFKGKMDETNVEDNDEKTEATLVLNEDENSQSKQAFASAHALKDLVSTMEQRAKIDIESKIEIAPLLDQRTFMVLYEIFSQFLRNSIKAALDNDLSSMKLTVQLKQSESQANRVRFVLQDNCGGLDLERLLPEEDPLTLEHQDPKVLYEKLLQRNVSKEQIHTEASDQYWGGLGLGLERIRFLSRVVLQGQEILGNHQVLGKGCI
jgi:hypothetical protein